MSFDETFKQKTRHHISSPERALCSLFSGTTLISGYVPVSWSEKELLAFTDLKDTSIRRSELRRLRRAARRAVAAVYAALYFVAGFVIVLAEAPVSDWRLVVSLCCFLILPPMQGLILASHGGLWHHKLIALNSAIEVLNVSELKAALQTNGSWAGANKVVYLRSFRREELTEFHSQEGAVGQANYRWRYDNSSAYIHRSIQAHCTSQGMIFIEAANLRRPIVSAATSAMEEGILSLSLYDSPDWRNEVTDWITKAELIVLNINGETESLRYELNSALGLGSRTRLLIERTNWHGWVQSVLPPSFPLHCALIYDNVSEKFEGNAGVRLAGTKSIACFRRSNNGHLVDAGKIVLLNWLNDPESVLTADGDN